MVRRPRIIGNRPWLIVAILLAAVVHIVSVLAMPRLAPDDAFARLEKIGLPNVFRGLPQALPSLEQAPYNDPAIAAGVCVYDLVDGPLRVRAKLRGGAFMSMSFHSRRDRVYYAMTDKAATHRMFDVVVATQTQLDAIKAKDNPDDPPQELRLVAPDRRGFVFARALASDASARRDAAAAIAAVSCAIDREAAL